MMRPFCMVVFPPWITGVMWSASGLSGCLLVPHARGVPQMGQRVCPACLARWISLVRHWRCLDVPVLLIILALYCVYSV
nr:MAG TPA: TniQ [Caudoviricetes sp.]